MTKDNEKEIVKKDDQIDIKSEEVAKLMEYVYRPVSIGSTEYILMKTKIDAIGEDAFLKMLEAHQKNCYQ